MCVQRHTAPKRLDTDQLEQLKIGIPIVAPRTGMSPIGTSIVEAIESSDPLEHAISIKET